MLGWRWEVQTRPSGRRQGWARPRPPQAVSLGLGPRGFCDLGPLGPREVGLCLARTSFVSHRCLGRDLYTKGSKAWWTQFCPAPPPGHCLRTSAQPHPQQAFSDPNLEISLASHLRASPPPPKPEQRPAPSSLNCRWTHRSEIDSADLFLGLTEKNAGPPTPLNQLAVGTTRPPSPKYPPWWERDQRQEEAALGIRL